MKHITISAMRRTKSTKMRRTREAYPNGTGRPSSYKPAYAKIAEQICMLCHSLNEVATRVKLADVFGVDETTLGRWLVEHEEFRVAVKDGRDAAAGEVVASLYKRAKGYTYVEERVTRDDKGKVIGSTSTIKHMAADTGAMCFALKNWAPDYWKERREIAGVPDKPLLPARTHLDVHLLDDRALEVLMRAITSPDLTGFEDGTDSPQPTRH